MDELKASPQNDWLAAIASALRSGRDFANQVKIPDIAKLLPVIGPLLANQKMGDMAYGRSPEGAEQMSYGEAPITLPTLAKPMGFPKNEEGGLRAMDQLEALGAMPFGSPAGGAGKTTGAAAGMFLPYIKGAKGLPGFQTPGIEKLIDRAMDMLRSGHAATEAGQDTGMWLVPRGGHRNTLSTLDPDNAAFMIEVPDSRLALKPAVLDRKGKPRKFGQWSFDEAVDAPNLKDIAPHIKDMQVNFDSWIKSQGKYDFSKGHIYVNPDLAPTNRLAEDTVRHELGHGFQYHTNELPNIGEGRVWKPSDMSMPGGGNLEMFSRRSAAELETMDEVIDQLTKVPASQRSSEEKKLLGFLNTLDNSHASNKFGYEHLLGEQQAEAGVFRKDLTPNERRKVVSPYDSYKVHPFKNPGGIDPADFSIVTQILRNDPGTPPELVQKLLEQLRKPTNPAK